MATERKETTRDGGGRKSVLPTRFVLPAIPTAAHLLEAVERMTPQEAQQAFRHRVLPLSWEPGKTVFVAAGERAKAYAAEHGLDVTAVTNERTMLRELQRGREAELLSQAVWALKNRYPRASAAEPFSAQQALWLVFCFAFVAFAWMWDRQTSEVTAFAAMLALFALMAGVKLWCLMPAEASAAPLAMKIADSDLPVYSVLVPLFNETKIAAQTVAAIKALDYPPAKLDIKIIIEADDEAMTSFFDEERLPAHMEVIAVPASEPRTRAKALSYALIFAQGELVAVYDADNIPATDQLRRVAGTFALAPKTVGCLQTQIGFVNRNENWLTRQCALEKSFLFRLQIPRLARFGVPLPGAGVSSHYRMAALRKVGGFDPHNVGRDSGLGIRLARAGKRTAVIPSLTREEAARRLRDWLPQRARWIRGSLQSAIVNSRSPLRMWRELGGRNFLLTQALTGGAIITSLLHPVFLLWTAAAALLVRFELPAPGRLWLFLLALYVLVALAAFLVNMVVAFRSGQLLGRGAWGMTILTQPFYWLLVSLATWLAVIQYFARSARAAKTAHGVTRVRPQIGGEKKVEK